MANKPIEFIMLKEILRLKSLGLSNLKISQSIGSSRTTVIKYLKMFEASGIDNTMLSNMEDEELIGIVEGNPSLPQGEEARRYSSLLDIFPSMENDLKKVGVTRWHLWAKYKQLHPDGYSYSQFCYHFQQWRGQSESYMHQDHKAGDKMFVDFAGKKLNIIDCETRELVSTEVFVAILGASQRTYVEACRSQSVENFIEACQNALYYFWGVPKAIVTDNLKSSVIKSDKYEPVLNENFAGFGQHYGMTILPARSYKPKDKALVEGAVKIVYHRIYTKLHDKEFNSIKELNDNGILPLLNEYNNTNFQNRDYSRNDLFDSIDKGALMSLPLYRYDFKQYKQSTVQKNCHVYISGDNHYYSVPYRYIGQKVKVLYTVSDVEIYFNNLRIAYHKRDYRKYGYTTIKEHLPSSHQFISEWSPERFKCWAESIGPNCVSIIVKILESKGHPEQGYKSCFGILSMTKKVGKERMENACIRALSYEAHNYRTIKNILEKGLDKSIETEDPILKLPIHENIRGKAYYN